MELLDIVFDLMDDIEGRELLCDYSAPTSNQDLSGRRARRSTFCSVAAHLQDRAMAAVAAVATTRS